MAQDPVTAHTHQMEQEPACKDVQMDRAQLALMQEGSNQWVSGGEAGSQEDS